MFEAISSPRTSSARAASCRRTRRSPSGSRARRTAPTCSARACAGSASGLRSAHSRVSPRRPWSPQTSRADSLVPAEQLPQLGELLAPELVALTVLDPPDEIQHKWRKLDRVERLRHVVDAAQVDALCAVLHLGASSQKDDRDFARPL